MTASSVPGGPMPIRDDWSQGTMTDFERTTAYLARRRATDPWGRLLDALVGGIYHEIGKDQGDRFLRMIGSRLGSDLPLGTCAALPDLEVNANRCLEILDWGWIRIEEV